MKRIRCAIMVVFLCAMLLFSSGCAALLLLGIGGAGGYLIKKGEGEDRKRSSLEEQVDQKVATSTKGAAGQELAFKTEGTLR